ncbi:hypothetical protein [Bosea sp. (in: a-proteobacteria)]|jgi:hypothetical protein|uniref:hypothetical protein n=1 Tax=Bosea sp. (in: a-proteobacteria) TaxID=1871050 RepID=UPI002DDC987F|nr:hypothetical protein [Bosea sp. (in: a-proteobacteria)]HEV2509809.1 hypothetical protein [Bosea sp. (in: a-proteobacteria)]
MTRPADLATCLLALAALALPLAVATPAAAEVRFGNNVRIGGHDASNQRFDRRNRGVYHIYEGRPRNPGCSWRSDGRGGRVKVCHLQRIKRR